MQQYPLLQRRDRGDRAGRAEIAFCEGLNYEDAQHVADAIAAKLRLVITNRLNGPDAWLWDARSSAGRFVFSYNDALREVTDANDVPLFRRLDIMHHWAENGLFDLMTGDHAKLPLIASRLYVCIGRAMADFVTRGVDAGTDTPDASSGSTK